MIISWLTPLTYGKSATFFLRFLNDPNPKSNMIIQKVFELSQVVHTIKKF